jgi:endonuclease YncB( thermonuclease family)
MTLTLRKILYLGVFITLTVMIASSVTSCESCSRSGRDAIARRKHITPTYKESNKEQQNTSKRRTQPEVKRYTPPVVAKPPSGSPLNEMYRYLRRGVFLVYATNDGLSGAQGSGFFIDQKGVGVTNFHVLDGFDEFFIKTYDDKVYKIDNILYTSNADNYDYAIFEIDNLGDSFTALPIAQKESEIGEDIFAIGNPLGLEATITKGIISGYRENGKIQHDAEIEHGSSGGPLFNMAGEVIGINTSIIESTNLNFAVDIRKLNLSSRPFSQNNRTDKNNTQTTFVKRVIDGDTFVLESGERVRLIGVDTPETVHPQKPVEPFGPEASAFTKKHIEGKKVRLEFDVDKNDHYNRILAYVFINDIFLNEELLKEGLAIMSTYPPNVKYVDLYESAQKYAKEKNKGIWSL